MKLCLLRETYNQATNKQSQLHLRHAHAAVEGAMGSRTNDSTSLHENALLALPFQGSRFVAQTKRTSTLFIFEEPTFWNVPV